MKTCTYCKTTKEYNCFNKDKSKPDGHLPRCKDCRYNLRDTAKERLASARYRLKNLDKIRSKSAGAALKHRYGISLEQRNELLSRQDGKCAICYRSGNLFIKGLNVDHCHKTGKVRGMLCSRCNYCLGLLNDNMELFLNSAKYLKESA